MRIAFAWLRAVLRLPLASGARVVMFGSAAELRGSPLSGGYAGAKATVRLITGYAAGEASGTGITMTTVLPVITPGTTVGDTAIEGYARSSGRTPQQFRDALPAAPSPASVGAAVVGLAAIPDADLASAYLVDAGGLRPLGSA
ncbi:hypothetical protein [Actinoplanes sp. URMC 104]|uniref:hypothetical protein n=1 Tax=Actinoplanes sp. URMC 104 TaxID=3423409 RepID=UPI003F1BCB25